MRLLTRAERNTWLTLQDARISRCPGCDDWRWDHACARCRSTAVAA